MKQLARTFFALWYVVGWSIHLYLGLRSPQVYEPFGRTALFQPIRTAWGSIVMPHIRLYSRLLAAFELITGLLLLSKGMGVKVGLLFSIAFNFFLVQLGLAWPAPTPVQDFLVNRLPNLLFALGQLPLLHQEWEDSIWELIGKRVHSIALTIPQKEV